MRYHWTTGWLDDLTRVLHAGGQTRPITQKAFALFRHLLHASPRVVTKAELLDQVWPDTYVSEANLAVLIGELRAAIGDSPRTPTIIKTHFGVGYSVVDRVVIASGSPAGARPGAAAVLVVAGRSIVLAQGVQTVGRDGHCDVVIAESSVSRHHADLYVRGEDVEIVDRSKNGTFVSGVRIEGPTPLKSGDHVRFGEADVEFRLDRAEGSTRTLR